jgi:hypothetical protein
MEQNHEHSSHPRELGIISDRLLELNNKITATKSNVFKRGMMHMNLWVVGHPTSPKNISILVFQLVKFQ